MIAKDINSNPTQYRTWVVLNTPDYNAVFYTGPKSGTNDFVDITAYAIEDNNLIADFNLPSPKHWRPDNSILSDFPIRKVLPAPIEDSQLAIVDGYIYMFGSKISNKIYRANISNPADWIDTAATLPNPLYGASLAIIDGYLYLFGGNDGYGATDTIFSAPTSNPLIWTNHGHLLPQKLYYSSLGMYNGNIYLFGGKGTHSASNAILSAPTSNPLGWFNAGFLPVATYGSTISQIDGYWRLFGGELKENNSTNTIWKTLITSPTNWSLDGYLPYSTAFSQFFTMGNDGYMIGPMMGANSNGFTSILQCHLDTPSAWLDVQRDVPGVISHSQVAFIADRVWLFGGSGETAIFTCNQDIKFDFNVRANNYGHITRVLFPLTDNIHNPFQALCFPFWKTDYKL